MSGNSSDVGGKAVWIKGLLKGWNKRFPKSLGMVPLLDREMPREEVSAVFEEALAACDEVDRLRTRLKHAVANRNAKLAACDPLATAVESLVRGIHGTSLQALQDYGLEPPKKASLSGEKQFIASQKRLATRELRRTLGRRQREAITLQPKPTVQVLGPDGTPLGTHPIEAPAAVPERVSLTEIHRSSPEQTTRLLPAPEEGSEP